MTSNNIPLEGCASVPLSNYLKALGILRLIANPLNHVKGTAADSDIRGYWGKNRFNLNSKLKREELLRFFLEYYVPSPIIAPWNGGSGFYPKDNKTAFDLLSKSNDIAQRFFPLHESIKIAEEEILKRKLTQRPEGKTKVKLISTLRNKYQEFALSWVDAVLALSKDQVSFPPLLGTGGNDGRLDFTNNFIQRLVSNKTGLFDVKTGQPLLNTEKLLQASLFGNISQGLHNVAIGQFSPGSAGGPNATSSSYESEASVNPWDFIFTLEGSIMFAGAATRRHQSKTDSVASFPFMVKTVGAGYGGISSVDEEKSRAEFWAPLWNQPASYQELKTLFKEGRAVLHGKTAFDGLDFARAATSFGVSRGVEYFKRYGFAMRSGKAFLAVPLGKQKVSCQVTDATKLINDLDAGGWLDRIRKFARRSNFSSYGRQVLKQFEDSLFYIAKHKSNPRTIQNTLCSLGDFISWLAINENVTDEKSSPPPCLSSEWVHKANDGTYEYRIACALASLGWQPGKNSASESIPEEISVLSNSNQELTENDFEAKIPMAAHFAPVVPSSVPKKFRKWDTMSNERLTVFPRGNLTSTLIAILERRLVEQSIKNLEEKPFYAATHVNWADISAFLSPGFNYALCTRLLSGLIWARPVNYLQPRIENISQQLPPLPPFSYAVLKPIFTTEKTLEKECILPPNSRMPIPPGLIARLRSEKMDNAIRMALARTKASGIKSSFASGMRASSGINYFSTVTKGHLLAASLLIPLYEKDLKYVMKQAYIIE